MNIAEIKGVSIIIPVFNKFEITLQCVNHINEFNKNGNFELVIVDNGSTDRTSQVFSTINDIVYIRNDNNLGIAKAYNIGSKIAKNEVLCFMHNDVLIFKNNWVAKTHDFLLENSQAGIAGLYGAKVLRDDGSFRGKTIVHSKRGSSSIKRNYEKVAVVDGLFMAIQKSLFDRIGGFNECFPVHYYDKDLSMRSAKYGYINYVLSIPFEHLCATTRKDVKAEGKIRYEAQKKFIEIWSKSLPFDVCTLREKILYIFANRKKQT